MRRRSGGSGVGRIKSGGLKLRLTILVAAILAAQTSQAQYPPACPPIEKVVVCGDEPLFEDEVVQRETAMPDGCELAAWYATHVPREEVLAFAERLVELMDEAPELFDEPRSYQFLECIYAILE